MLLLKDLFVWFFTLLEWAQAVDFETKLQTPAGHAAFFLQLAELVQTVPSIVFLATFLLFMADINTHYSPTVRWKVSDFTVTLARTFVENVWDQVNLFLLWLYAVVYAFGQYYLNPLYLFALAWTGIEFALDRFVGLFRASS